MFIGEMSNLIVEDSRCYESSNKHPVNSTILMPAILL